MTGRDVGKQIVTTSEASSYGHLHIQWKSQGLGDRVFGRLVLVPEMKARNRIIDRNEGNCGKREPPPPLLPSMVSSSPIQPVMDVDKYTTTGFSQLIAK